MVDSNIPHEIEDRLKNIEKTMGIGHTDEDGNYTVDQHDPTPAAEETAVDTEHEVL